MHETNCSTLIALLSSYWILEDTKWLSLGKTNGCWFTKEWIFKIHKQFAKFITYNWRQKKTNKKKKTGEYTQRRGWMMWKSLLSIFSCENLSHWNSTPFLRLCCILWWNPFCPRTQVKHTIPVISVKHGGGINGVMGMFLLLVIQGPCEDWWH